MESIIKIQAYCNNDNNDKGEESSWGILNYHHQVVNPVKKKYSLDVKIGVK